jgi:hypothetical protein
MAGGGGWVKEWIRLWTFNKKGKTFCQNLFSDLRKLYFDFFPFFISNVPMITEAFKREIKDKENQINL